MSKDTFWKPIFKSCLRVHLTSIFYPPSDLSVWCEIADIFLKSAEGTWLTTTGFSLSFNLWRRDYVLWHNGLYIWGIQHRHTLLWIRKTYSFFAWGRYEKPMWLPHRIDSRLFSPPLGIFPENQVRGWELCHHINSSLGELTEEAHSGQQWDTMDICHAAWQVLRGYIEQGRMDRGTGAWPAPDKGGNVYYACLGRATASLPAQTSALGHGGRVDQIVSEGI